MFCMLNVSPYTEKSNTRSEPVTWLDFWQVTVSIACRAAFSKCVAVWFLMLPSRWSPSTSAVAVSPTQILVPEILLTHWGRGHLNCLNCLNARYRGFNNFNPLNSELNPICYLLALLAHHFLHVSRIRVQSLILRLLMSYIYMWH